MTFVAALKLSIFCLLCQHYWSVTLETFRYERDVAPNEMEKAHYVKHS